MSLTCADFSSTVETRLALALEFTCLRYQKAISIDIAMHLRATHLAWIGAFRLRSL